MADNLRKLFVDHGGAYGCPGLFTHLYVGLWSQFQILYRLPLVIMAPIPQH